MINDIKSIYKEIKLFLSHFSISEIFKYILMVPLNIFKHIFYLSSFLVPRRKDIWLFGSWGGKRFGDNSKYMFLHVANNHKKIKSIWISKDKDIVEKLRGYGYNAFYAFGLKGIYYNLRAKYIFSDNHFDSVNFWCCGGATKIQLWHASPIKKIEHDVKNLLWNKPLNKFIYMYFNPWLLAKNNYIISIGDFFVDNFVSAFQIRKDDVLVTGYPRNDVIFNHINGENLIDIDTYNKYKNLNMEFSKLVLYMPTFRDDLSPDNFNLDKIIDFEETNKFLAQINGCLIVKLHPIIKKKFENYDRIVFLPNSFDIYPLLSQIDILITDYSSIYFDFLLVDKPIIFYPYDLQKYTKDNRELYFDYEEITPGPKATTFGDLLYWIDYFAKGNDKFVEIRRNIKEISFKHLDGASSERIYGLINNL